jgi:hypothetical protein
MFIDFKAFLMDNEIVPHFVYLVYILFTFCLPKILDSLKFPCDRGLKK